MYGLLKRPIPCNFYKLLIVFFFLLFLAGNNGWDGCGCCC